MKKKTLLLSLLLVGLVMPLAACDNNDDDDKPDPVTLVLSGPEGAKAYVQGQFNAWKATSDKYSNYVMEYAIHGENDVDSIADWGAKTAPDIYAFASDKIGNLYKAGALAEVPRIYADAIKADMTSAGAAASQFVDKTYAYPYAGDNGYFLFYNSDYFTDADVATWEGIVAKAATHEGKKISYNATEAFYGAGIMFSFGAKYDIDFTAAGDVSSVEADFNGAKGLLGARALYDITHNAQWQASQAVTDGDPLILCVDGAWNVAAHTATLGDKLKFAKLPTITVGEETANLGSFLGCKLYGVNPEKAGSDATRLTDLHNLANYLVSKEAQAARFDALAVAPTNKEAAASDKVKASPSVAAINAQAEFATAQTAVPGGLWTAFGAFAEGIRDLKEWSDAAAQALLETLNTAIEKV